MILVARIKQCLFWLIIPFALPQALYVKKVALRLPQAMGSNKGRVAGGPNDQLTLVGIGDSVIAGVGVKHQKNALIAQTAACLAKQYLTEVNWMALGKNGASSADIYKIIPQQLPDHRVDIFVLSIGVNDVTTLTSLKRWQKNLKAIITQLTEHSPEALITFLGVPPMATFPALPSPLRFILGYRAKRLDLIAQQIFAEQKNGTHLKLAIRLNAKDIAIDGFHPSEYACKKMAKAINESIVLKPEKIPMNTTKKNS